MKKYAVITGSFDPVTTGHEHLVKLAGEVFEKVVVLVCCNFEKEYLFDFEKRVEITRQAFKDFPNVSVEKWDNWLYEWLLKHPDAVIVKGVRNALDLEYEREMAKFNYEKSASPTVFLTPNDEFLDISSTKVRHLLAEKGDWKKFVPQNAQKIVEKFYAEK